MEKKRGSLERPFRMKAFWRKAKTFREAMLSPRLSRWGRRLLAGGAVYVFSFGPVIGPSFPLMSLLLGCVMNNS